jgi:hypothetical protein
MVDPPRDGEHGAKPTYRRVATARFASGTGFGGTVWLLLAILAVIVALDTSGVVSVVFWSITALLLLLAVVLFGAYVTGHGRGGWTTNGIDQHTGGLPPKH